MQYKQRKRTHTDRLALVHDLVKESLAGAVVLGKHQVHVRNRLALHLCLSVRQEEVVSACKSIESHHKKLVRCSP